ncbi:MAG: hypothetical protein HY909_10980 [Deltaproteobacteria bacterium]|nr:hypothetical protein [Deltaproteobacteria bacterium]
MESLRFVPSRVEGLAGVTEVTARPDRLELVSEGRLVTVLLASIADWPWPRRLRRLLARAGLRPRWLPVGDRDWFHEPQDRFIRFFTTPPLTVYMPDERGVAYEHTCFRRLQDVIARGGFTTNDLG